jgi:hypothetical protein
VIKKTISLGALALVVVFMTTLAIVASAPLKQVSASNNVSGSCPNTTQVKTFANITVPFGESRTTAPFDVSCFANTRLVFDNKGSTNVTVMVNIIENKVILSSNPLTASAGASATNTYELPGRTISLTVVAAVGGLGATGQDTVDLYLFGHS